MENFYTATILTEIRGHDMFFKKSNKLKPEAIKSNDGLATADTPNPNQYFCLISSSKEISTPDQLTSLLANKICMLGELKGDITYFKTQNDLLHCIEAFQKLNGLDKPQDDNGMLRKIEYFFIVCFEINPAIINITPIKLPNLDFSRLSPEKMKYKFYEGDMVTLSLKNISNEDVLSLRQENSTYFSKLPVEILNSVAENVKINKHRFPLDLISINVIKGWGLLELDKTSIEPLNINIADKQNKPR